MDKCQVCGETADYGCHGIRDGEVYSEHYCEKHYNAKKRGRELEESKPEESAVQSSVSKELVPERQDGRGVQGKDSEVQADVATVHLPVQSV